MRQEKQITQAFNELASMMLCHEILLSLIFTYVMAQEDDPDPQLKRFRDICINKLKEASDGKSELTDRAIQTANHFFDRLDAGFKKDGGDDDLYSDLVSRLKH